MITTEQAYQILHDLREFSSLHESLYHQELLALEDMMSSHTYKVAVIGEFSVGKSTFLNALIGKQLLYSSNGEATGTIICVEHGLEKKATVLQGNGQEDLTVRLTSKEGLAELTSWVDVNRADKASRIHISYPIQGFEENIMLIDTPGLGGFSIEQAAITKELLKEANGTILLISHKGLQRTELDLLLGRNQHFGLIETKELFVVINQIGNYFESRSAEEANRKIEETVHGVKQELAEHGVFVSGVFALDSQDYLWSQDHELYANLKEQYKNNRNFPIYPTSVYEERSRFNDFKKFMIEYLLQGNQQQRLMQDIMYKMRLLSEAFLEVVEINKKQSMDQQDQKLSLLQLQKDSLIENRRKLYNGLARYLRETLDTFIYSAEKDISERMEQRDKDAAKIADSSIQQWGDLNPKKAEACRSQLEELLKQDYAQFQTLLTGQLQLITDVMIDKKMSSDLSLMMKKQVQVGFEFINAPMQFKFQKEEIRLAEAEFLEDDRLELSELQHTIEEFKLKIETFKFSDLDHRMSQIEHSRRDSKQSYNAEIASLSKRPEPRAVYRTKTEKKKVWLIFNKNVDTEVFEKWDYSEVDKWEAKREAIEQKYLKNEQVINKKVDSIRSEQHQMERTKLRLRELYERESELKDLIVTAEKELKQKFKDNERIMLGQKKMELYNRLRTFSRRRLQELVDHVVEHASQVSSAVKNHMQENLDRILENFAIELDKSIYQIRESLNNGMQLHTVDSWHLKLAEYRRVLHEF